MEREIRRIWYDWLQLICFKQRRAQIKQNREHFTGWCDSYQNSLFVKAVWCTKAVEWIARQESETWKNRQFAEENPQNVPLSGYQAPVDRVQRAAVEPSAQLGKEANKAPIRKWDFAWNCHSPLKCAQDISPWSPAQMLQTIVQLLSEANRISRLTRS